MRALLKRLYTKRWILRTVESTHRSGKNGFSPLQRGSSNGTKAMRNYAQLWAMQLVFRNKNASIFHYPFVRPSYEQKRTPHLRDVAPTGRRSSVHIGEEYGDEHGDVGEALWTHVQCCFSSRTDEGRSVQEWKKGGCCGLVDGVENSQERWD